MQFYSFFRHLTDGIEKTKKIALNFQIKNNTLQFVCHNFYTEFIFLKHLFENLISFEALNNAF